MLFSRLVETSAAVAATRSRTHKRELLAVLLSAAETPDQVLLLYYLCGEIPQGKIGIGPALLRRVDALSVAGEPALSLATIDQTLDRFAAIAGKGARAAQVELLTELFSKAVLNHRDLLGRLLLGELRQGALDGVLLEAAADVANVLPSRLRRAAMLAGSLPVAACAAIKSGDAGLDQFQLTPLRALQPMLAQPAETLSAALGTIPDAFIEAKLDGARVQIHRDGGRVRVYSRQLNDVTASVPEVVAAVRSLTVDRVILDGEVLALRDDGTPRPFQETMRRFGRRKASADDQRLLPLSLAVFDCLLVGDDVLIDQAATVRFAQQDALLPPSLSVPRLRTTSVADADAFMRNVLNGGHEGVMVKAPDSVYAAGNRGADWLKVKPVYTLDLVVLAAEWGSGRRRGWLSNLHLGCRDEATGEFVMLGKTFKGLTDATLKWQTGRLLALETSRERQTVYVRPELVVEIALSGIQASMQYPAGMALRFARVRHYREDKGATDADTLSSVRQIFDNPQAANND